MNLQAETEFFHDIAARVTKLVRGYGGRANVARYKFLEGDVATEVDLDVEKLIADEINKCFPEDDILAEEEHHDSQITEGRIWIIDPICGTTNIGRGIAAYCTNIALAYDRHLVAACVIDHSKGEYFWSIGGGTVYAGNTVVEPRTDDDSRKIIEVDLGGLPNVDDAKRKIHMDAIQRLLQIPGYLPLSLNSSLSFAYTATGKVDGFINAHNKPWDICAAAFLVQQSGGKLTDLVGNPWTLESAGAIGARTESIHQKLLAAYSAHD